MVVGARQTEAAKAASCGVKASEREEKKEEERERERGVVVVAWRGGEGGWAGWVEVVEKKENVSCCRGEARWP